jgi:hypothetical protein
VAAERLDRGSAAVDNLVPTLPRGGLSTDLLSLVDAIVGATIAPWQLRFQQSRVADKRLPFADLKAVRCDEAISVFAGWMMPIRNVMFLGGRHHEVPARMAIALKSLIGRFGHGTTSRTGSLSCRYRIVICFGHAGRCCPMAIVSVLRLRGLVMEFGDVRLFIVRP